MSDKVLKGSVSNYRYIWRTNSGACEKCQELNNRIYDSVDDIPAKPHPNCQCSVEIIDDKINNSANEILFHEELKQAAKNTYNNSKSETPQRYKIIKSVQNPSNGFYADVLYNGKDIIIAYRGTEQSINDIRNDVAMARSRIPAQATDAISLYDAIRSEYPNANITLTGHSLGGSLSQIVSAIRGVKAVTFNAYGVRDMFKKGTQLKEKNIVNYLNEQDVITMINGQNHLGKIYSIENIGQKVLDKHFLEGMGDLSNRVGKSQNEIEEILKRRYYFLYVVEKLLKNGI